MAKSKEPEDVAVDGLGRPLPLVKLRDRRGNVHEVREAASLSNLHYGPGLEFDDDGMTYAKALAVMLGEDEAKRQVVDVPPEGGDVVWPDPYAPEDEAVVEDDSAKENSKSTSKSD